MNAIQLNEINLCRLYEKKNSKYKIKHYQIVAYKKKYTKSITELHLNLFTQNMQTHEKKWNQQEIWRFKSCVFLSFSFFHNCYIIYYLSWIHFISVCLILLCLCARSNGFSAKLHGIKGQFAHWPPLCKQQIFFFKNANYKKNKKTYWSVRLAPFVWVYCAKKNKLIHICALFNNDNNCFFFGFSIQFFHIYTWFLFCGWRCIVVDLVAVLRVFAALCCEWWWKYNKNDGDGGNYSKWPNSGGKSLSNMRQSIKGKKYLIVMFQLNLNVAFAPQRYVRTFPSINAINNCNKQNPINICLYGMNILLFFLLILLLMNYFFFDKIFKI